MAKKLLVLVLMFAVASAGFGGSAEARTVTPGDESRVFRMSETEFVKGAMVVAGLSEREARLAFRNPTVAARIPVSVTEHSVAIASAPTSDDEMYSTMSHAPWRGCTLHTWRNWENVFGQRLARFNAHKYWEGNGHSVRNVGTWETGSTTAWASITWHYAGVSASSDWWSSWNGNSRGAHNGSRTGRWEAAGPGGTHHITINQTVRADGSWTSSVGSGKCF